MNIARCNEGGQSPRGRKRKKVTLPVLPLMLRYRIRAPSSVPKGGRTNSQPVALTFILIPACLPHKSPAAEKSREGRDPRGTGTDSARQKVVVSAEEVWTGIPLNYSLHYLTRLKSFRIVFQSAIGLASEQKLLWIPAPPLAPHRADGGSKA